MLLVTLKILYPEILMPTWVWEGRVEIEVDCLLELMEFLWIKMGLGIGFLGLFVPNTFSMFGEVLVHGRRYYGLN